RRRFRRTLVGLKLDTVFFDVVSEDCFRRTLVGLKLIVHPLHALQRFLFQTNPCGIEATDPLSPSRSDPHVSDDPLWD
ncbi:hypothetical protein, partial [Haloferax sp. Atlit-4N]|uniref:hypothetical protein n=1 Tax=Haloferax sp. Atlit-4N TaxID=2077206 RepID=UPI001F2C925A